LTKDQTILSELRATTRTQPDWAALVPLLADDGIGVHLAVMNEPFLTYLLSGQKTVESRFSQRPIQPYEQVAAGDLVLLKAGPVVGSFIVASVECRTLAPGELAMVRSSHARAICAHDDAFWQTREGKRFVTLTWVSDVRKLTPLTVTKRDMRGWVVLRAPRSTGATESPYRPTQRAGS
jgi:hypothetical protein